jgi:hypothetical protein
MLLIDILLTEYANSAPKWIPKATAGREPVDGLIKGSNDFSPHAVDSPSLQTSSSDIL